MECFVNPFYTFVDLSFLPTKYLLIYLYKFSWKQFVLLFDLSLVAQIKTTEYNILNYTLCDEEAVAVSDRETKIQIRKTKSKSNIQSILPYTSPSSILNKLLSFQWTKFEKMLSIVLCETIFKFSYMFIFKSLPLPLLTVRHIYEISQMTTYAGWTTNHSDAPAIIDGLFTPLARVFPRVQIAVRN